MRIASHRVAPSAYAASRCACGTARSTSRAIEEVNGITMTARISAAASIPTPSGGPVKSGTPLSHSGVFTWNCRTSGTSTKTPQSP